MVTQAIEPGAAPSLAEFLEGWAWYLAHTPELRALVLNTTTERMASPGEYIARAGEPCAHWYGVSRGYLQMYVVGPDGDETTLYCLREGEWGGDGSLLKKELRQYDLRSLTSSRIWLVPAQTFETLRTTSIEFNQYLCELMNSRMGDFVTMLAASRLLGPDMRVARALLMIADKHGSDTQELSFPQHELALICGLSRQRVNMALSGLKQRGLVSSENSKGSLVVHVQSLRTYLMTEG
jgi:CRP/FNR family cyclic AMP-dependent transcriptional regulator